MLLILKLIAMRGHQEVFMFHVTRTGVAGLLFLLAAMLTSAPAFAQITDFAGEWDNRNHEDAYDRVGSQHALPGKHPYLTEWLPQFEVPLEAAKGHKETLYPECQLKLRKSSND